MELAGAPAPGAPAGARGFVGIAFRLQQDNETYDAFYLRPTNGRADDQERRNRSAQDISHPEWPCGFGFVRRPRRSMRHTSISYPENGARVKIDVRDSVARLYVHDNQQPTLIVNDVKTGPDGKGAVALWLDTGTVAHFP